MMSFYVLNLGEWHIYNVRYAFHCEDPPAMRNERRYLGVSKRVMV